LQDNHAMQDGLAAADILRWQARCLGDVHSSYQTGPPQEQIPNSAYPQYYPSQDQPLPGLPMGHYSQPPPIISWHPPYLVQYGPPQSQPPGQQLPTPLTSPPDLVQQYTHGSVPNTAHKPRKPAQEKRHICEICNKPFLRPSALRTHINTHTKETPFPCPIVDCARHTNAFSVKSNMVRHCRNGHAEHAEFLAQHKIFVQGKGKRKGNTL